MTKILLYIILLASTYGNRTSRMRVVDYISNHAHIAIKEYHRTCIPASVKLAQAILEGGYGTSYLSVNKCNHFG
ncbi:MAG: glucosaminidase domain-containing protein, partial [Aureispira sp.]|nr:glucosaminidase domain-containing protein [Aureispira sp.]